jgi:formate dehydrogenase iron-sulfur subunit
MATGFFTDTTVCIGCKACEVACKQWNQLPQDGLSFTGMSYDNTVQLGATTWRHVAFVERPGSWLMLSDVCKHCHRAGCLEACPTGAIVRTEFDSVFVQPDICNGCGYCVVTCPFGVIDRNEVDGRAAKCTLCYDRQKGGLEPACAKACPTDSIQFGLVEDLRTKAEQRVLELHAKGVTDAYLYGVDQPGTEGLNAIFLLVDRPEVYNLPAEPVVPSKRVGESWMAMGAAALGILAAAVFSARSSR